MYLESIKLYNFRNLVNTDLIFSAGLNFLVGNNGQGKTNLIEAINFLSTTKSFRTSKNSELISWQEKSFSIFGKVQRKVSDYELGISIEGKNKSQYLNSNKIASTKDYLGKLVCVCFTPTDLALVKGAPLLRRKFIDRHIVDLEPNLIESYMNFQRALKNKNILLKTNQANKANIDPWNQIIAQNSSIIVRARRDFVQALNRRIKQIHQKFSPNEEEINLELESDFLVENQILDANSIYQILTKNFDQEIKYKTSFGGSQKDDLAISIRSVDARAFASQGQTRSIVLSLKLAVIELIQEKYEDSPIILLDDVDSELDAERANRFFELVLSQKRQVIISGTKLSSFLENSKQEIKILQVESGKIVA